MANDATRTCDEGELMMVNDWRVRELVAAAKRGYGVRDVRMLEGKVRAAIGRIERGETRLEQEVRRLERPFRAPW